MLRHAQKWIDLPSNNNKKQKTSSNASPRSYTPGTNESHHVDEEDGPSHTSPSKGGRPDGQKKEKERRGKRPNSHGETLYMEAMEYSWSKREKADELREIKKKERNDERLAVETRRMEIKQETENRRLELQLEAENKRLELQQEVENKKIELKKQVENRRLDLQQQELELKQRMDDEKIMNLDLSGMSERQQKFYRNLQDEIIARRVGNI